MSNHAEITGSKRTYIRPTGHRVIVKPDDVEVMSKGGIITSLADKFEQMGQETGVVVAIGPQAFLAYCHEQLADGTTKWGEPWCKVGDRVVHQKYAGGGNRIKDPVTEEKFIIINDGDIKAVLEPKEGE